MTHLELLKFAQALLAENIDLRKRLAEEREACAQIAARWDDDVETRTKPSDAIRARGNV